MVAGRTGSPHSSGSTNGMQGLPGAHAVGHSFFSFQTRPRRSMWMRPRRRPRSCVKKPVPTRLPIGCSAQKPHRTGAAGPLPGPRCQADTQYSPPHPLAHRVGGRGVWPQCRPKRAARRTALRPPPPTPSHAPIALMRCSAARSRSLDGGALWFAVLCPPEVAPTCRPRSHRRARRPRPRPCPTPGRGVPPTPPCALATRSAWRFGTEGDTCSVACSASRSTGGVTLFSSLLVPLSSRSFLRSPALYRPTWYSLSLVV